MVAGGRESLHLYMAFSKLKTSPRIYANLHQYFENSRRLADKPDGSEGFEKTM
jgi:hypothetical protein